jgi:hypothetical protein
VIPNGQSRALRVSNNTVTAIAEQEWQRVDARKARIAAQAEQIATKAAEQLNESLDQRKISPQGLVPVFGVAVDKLTILRGEPVATFRHDHTHSHNHTLVAALNDAVARIQKRAQAAVVEVPSLPPRDPSVAGENADQKAS